MNILEIQCKVMKFEAIQNFWKNFDNSLLGTLKGELNKAMIFKKRETKLDKYF